MKEVTRENVLAALGMNFHATFDEPISQERVYEYINSADEDQRAAVIYWLERTASSLKVENCFAKEELTDYTIEKIVERFYSACSA